MAQFINSESFIFPWHLHPAQLYALAIEHGIKHTELLAALHLTSDDLLRVDLAISWQQYRAMAELISRKGPSDWSLLLGERLTIASHGLLSLAIMNCQDWAHALEMMVQYKNLVTALFYIEKKETDTHLILELHPEFSRDDLLNDFLQCFFIIVYQAIYRLSSFQRELEEGSADFAIYLQGPAPSYEDRMRHMFHNNLHFSQASNSMKINKRYLTIAIAQANPITANNMSALLRGQLLNKPLLKGELHALHDSFRQQHYRQTQCASDLNTSTTSLKRKLKQAQTHFAKELSLFRLNEACYLLRYTDCSLDDISHTLGYQDASSFRRSFKDAFNQLPKEYRAHNNQ